MIGVVSIGKHLAQEYAQWVAGSMDLAFNDPKGQKTAPRREERMAG